MGVYWLNYSREGSLTNFYSGSPNVEAQACTKQALYPSD
ncbi:hypothetical protein CPS_1303 [Colwellia psychrerythraea 34H]|uniref:Uncharacterized protein n=1 Tax=Colwellia psychrerythraea (strain 34H / ATCC BAA-681) TaxID=167879 RepID=Q486G9_COLP3|nr:hypothetical protein CPS_1303 [Colwellia psychrerythraea 34H]